MTDIPPFLPTASPALGSVVLPRANDWFNALLTDFSGAAAPAVPVAYMTWLDTTVPTAPVLKRRNSANSAWVTIPLVVPGTAAGQFRTNAQNEAFYAVRPMDDPLMNGDFSVVQKAESPLSPALSRSRISPDRWFVTGGGGFFEGILGKLVANTGAIGHLFPNAFLRLTPTNSAASHFGFVDQRMEHVRTYAGQTITLFGWGKRSAAGSVSVSLRQVFGTGGSPSATVVVNTTAAMKFALGTGWGPWRAVINVPSIAGKTIGTNDDDYLELRLWASAGSTFNTETNTLGLFSGDVDLFGLHSRPGDVPIEAINFYQHPDMQRELARCQRYYQVFTGVEECGRALEAPLSGNSRGNFKFVVEMRKAPTMTFAYAGGSGAGWIARPKGAIQNGAHSVNNIINTAIFSAEL